MNRIAAYAALLVPCVLLLCGCGGPLMPGQQKALVNAIYEYRLEFGAWPHQLEDVLDRKPDLKPIAGSRYLYPGSRNSSSYSSYDWVYSDSMFMSQSAAPQTQTGFTLFMTENARRRFRYWYSLSEQPQDDGTILISVQSSILGIEPIPPAFKGQVLRQDTSRDENWQHLEIHHGIQKGGHNTILFVTP